jgi:hypothetical protein
MGLTLRDRVAKSATRSCPRTEGWIDREVGGCEFRPIFAVGIQDIRVRLSFS